MRSTSLLLALVAASALAGCMETQGQRALAGGAAGAIIADAADQNMVAGAALGALAGGASCNAGIGGPCYR
ncbi:hypothetical protein H9N28_04750 [Rhodobacter capsulatus]|uniref:17 kDa surface antigen n=1 Tax=Rhodobacter capsulatus TaxID=1061 RepID=A0A0Q0QLV9_RHOCA|nr:hypothetical protein [Rhodobacter capsulatus]KQB11432.1 hypothetical protein AP071_09815 [Rhodobacter capsulatus]KQB12286.1 hypothetical protein AP073_06715 [Rhodobacter capsulatus]PZX25858.1 hypothetical protein LY44_01641 [Rhodobacter capsulatus]QNR64154.1 hypothetical protein H9N28_04750 [Rhodobacter capsulatus]WER10326.1 hypothetical protein PUH89_04825 [Rhodobacter capsulatus]